MADTEDQLPRFDTFTKAEREAQNIVEANVALHADCAQNFRIYVQNLPLAERRKLVKTLIVGNGSFAEELKELAFFATNTP